MAEKEEYNKEFFEWLSTHVKPTHIHASVLYPLIEKYYNINSVIDVGCGVGAWLNYFYDKKVKVKGIDMDWVPEKYMALPKNEFFQAYDLNKPINLNEKYDLAITIEVAEHLEPERADSFVEDLTKLSDVIMFSAALPQQGGYKHINEQLHEYWAKKFEKHNYKVVDIVRPNIWKDDRIAFFWIRRNVFLYVHESKLHLFPEKYHRPSNFLTMFLGYEMQEYFDMKSKRWRYDNYENLEKELNDLKNQLSVSQNQVSDLKNQLSISQNQVNKLDNNKWYKFGQLSPIEKILKFVFYLFK